MALTIIEEIKIIKGRINPEVITLEELIEQSSMGRSADMYATIKLVDKETQPLAQKYKDKILVLMAGVLANNSMYTTQLKRIIVSKLASTSVTASQLITSTDEQWVNFVENNMLEAFEILANILPEEKTEYDSIV